MVTNILRLGKEYCYLRTLSYQNWMLPLKLGRLMEVNLQQQNTKRSDQRQLESKDMQKIKICIYISRDLNPNNTHTQKGNKDETLHINQPRS